MANHRRKIVILLTVVAVLIGLNLIKEPATAEAQGRGAGIYAGMSVSTIGGHVYRMRPDGTVEFRQIQLNPDPEWAYDSTWVSIIPEKEIVATARDTEIKSAMVRTQIRSIAKAIELYVLDHDPRRLDGRFNLDLLLRPVGGRKPYLKSEDLIDPWGMRYAVREPSPARKVWYFDIVSAGPDGKFGTDDDITRF